MKLARLFGRRRGLTDFFRRFAAKELPAVLAGIGRPPAVRTEAFPFGHSGLIRRLFLSDGSSLILRAYFADPVRQTAFAHWHLNRYLAEQGFCVPAIHFRQTYRFPRGMADVDVVIEDFVEGTAMADAECENPVRRRQLAEILRRLHTIRSPRPGKTWLGGETADPLQRFAARAPTLFDRIRGQFPDVTAKQTEGSLAWIHAEIARRPAPSSYELVHSDFHRNNLKVTPTEEIALIDLGTLAYGCFETDLVDARWGFIDQVWWEGFCSDYFGAEPARRERFEQSATLFFAAFYLTKASSRAVRARKSLEKGNPRRAEVHRTKSRRYWNLFLAAVDGEPLRPDLSFPIDDD